MPLVALPPTMSTNVPVVSLSPKTLNAFPAVTEFVTICTIPLVVSADAEVTFNNAPAPVVSVPPMISTSVPVVIPFPETLITFPVLAASAYTCITPKDGAVADDCNFKREPVVRPVSIPPSTSTA